MLSKVFSFQGGHLLQCSATRQVHGSQTLHSCQSSALLFKLRCRSFFINHTYSITTDDIRYNELRLASNVVLKLLDPYLDTGAMSPRIILQRRLVWQKRSSQEVQALWGLSTALHVHCHRQLQLVAQRSVSALYY